MAYHYDEANAVTGCATSFPKGRRTRMVVAFDHRDIFIDPNPDAAISWAERERLFNLPRSSWADYNRDLISAGGGIFPRSLKSIAITPQIRALLALPEGTEHLTPNELITAALCAPVDLIYNGGIGTYIKASTETHADVGDRANNAIRVNGNQLRCRIIGEGGNLGMTQRGRIEAAQAGVILNTDAIDNSAGVDTRPRGEHQDPAQRRRGTRPARRAVARRAAA